MQVRALRPLVLFFLAGCSAPAPSTAPHVPRTAAVAAAAPEEAGAPEATDTAPDTAPASPAPAPSLAPPGFPAEDEFETTAEACDGLVPRLVEREDLRGPILDWCHVRAYHSSRNGRVRSRLDGSWIHDRDRPAAYAFYRQGVAAGYLDPEACDHHVVDESIARTRDERSFPSRWPYGTYCDRSLGECRPGNRGQMLASVAEDWHRHPPDYERFGTRGPFDNNHWVATKYLGGCFPPEELDRFDVGAAVVIERSIELCLRLEDKLDTGRERRAARAVGLPTSCSSHRDLRGIWHPRFWYSELPEALR